MFRFNLGLNYILLYTAYMTIHKIGVFFYTYAVYIMQRHITLFKSDSKSIYNVANIFYFKQMLFFWTFY